MCTVDRCWRITSHNPGLFESHEIQKGEISQKYKDNLEKQQTFTMEINRQNFSKKQMGDYLLAPLHGGVAFLILLAGFCGLTLYRKDCGRQIPFAVTGKWRREMPLFRCGAGGSMTISWNFVRVYAEFRF